MVMTQLTLILDLYTKSQKSFKVCNSLIAVRLFLTECTGECGCAGPDIDTGLQSYHQDNFHGPSNNCLPLAASLSAGAGLVGSSNSLASHKDSSVICRVFRIIICWLSLLMFHKIQTKLHRRFFFTVSGGKILIDPNHRNLQKFSPSGMWTEREKYWMISVIYIMAIMLWPVCSIRNLTHFTVELSSGQ